MVARGKGKENEEQIYEEPDLKKKNKENRGVLKK
jgi:hypothetical protein